MFNVGKMVAGVAGSAMPAKAAPAQAAQPAPRRRGFGGAMNNAAGAAARGAMFMADGGLVTGSTARSCGCVGESGGTGGTRSNQDYRK